VNLGSRAADGGHGHVHLDELLRRWRQEVEEGDSLGQALLDEAVDVGVDPVERLRDGVVAGGELGEEEDGRLQHLCADGVDEDLHLRRHHRGAAPAIKLETIALRGSANAISVNMASESIHQRNSTSA
jgi:hypothetical protein